MRPHHQHFGVTGRPLNSKMINRKERRFQPDIARYIKLSLILLGGYYWTFRRPHVSTGVVSHAEKTVKLKGRWPLPDVHLALWSNGACVLQEHVCIDPDPYLANEDVHIRDIISSSLIQCMFKGSKCRAVDIGGNIGLMTASMLQLGAHVTTVEPQLDLCAAIKRTASINGWDERLNIFCGGIGVESGTTHMDVNYADVFRIGGPIAQGVIKVPLFDLRNVIRPGHYQLVKIDTDSIDCSILADILDMIKASIWSFESFVLETWGRDCKNGLLAGVLHELQGLGYTVYRTLLWERQFDGNGSLPTALAIAEVPDYAVEKFDLRFSRYVDRGDADVSFLARGDDKQDELPRMRQVSVAACSNEQGTVEKCGRTPFMAAIYYEAVLSECIYEDYRTYVR